MSKKQKNKNDTMRVYKENILFDYFYFLKLIDTKYIDITNNSHIIKNVGWSIYDNVIFNFDTKVLKQIFEKYVLPFDYDSSIIAGGVFTEYNIVSKPLNVKRFESLLSNKDTDIFIQSFNNLCTKTSKYLELFLQNNFQILGIFLKLFFINHLLNNVQFLRL